MAEIRARDALNDDPEDITSISRTLSVNSNYVHKVGINAKFHRESGLDTVTTAAIVVDDTVISLASVAGLVANTSKIELQLGLEQGDMLFTVTAISSLDVTLDMPIPIAVASGAVVKQIEINLASANGTLAAPVLYTTHPPAGAIWQISRLMLTMTSASAMDDSLFGAHTALPNGFMLRSDTDELRHMEIWKSNEDIGLTMYDLKYALRAPAGFYGLKARWTFTKSDYIMTLDGDRGDSLILYIQDTVDTNVTIFAKVQGRVFGS